MVVSLPYHGYVFACLQCNKLKISFNNFNENTETIWMYYLWCKRSRKKISNLSYPDSISIALPKCIMFCDQFSKKSLFFFLCTLAFTTPLANLADTEWSYVFCFFFVFFFCFFFCCFFFFFFFFVCLFVCFFFFSENRLWHFKQQTICIKCRNLFSGKHMRYFKCLLEFFTQHAEC